MSDELVIKNKDNKPAGAFIPGKKPSGLAARREAAQASIPPEERVIEPEEMEHRLGILFDDSSSMGVSQIKDAIEGVEEFLRCCTAGQTSVALQPLNAQGLRLNSNLPAVAIFTKKLFSRGGTPMMKQVNSMLRENNLTRAIVFSDGEPTDFYGFESEPYQNILAKGIPVDTVYIPEGNISPKAEEFMKKLASDTGGIYLLFQRGKANFRTAFKYLSPGLRHLLADKSFVAKLEGR